jgi:hypothetical protein
MKQLIFIISIWAAASFLNGLHAQIITVSPGSDLTIKQGTVFSADSLILTPSADFTLSNLSLNKNTAVSHALSKPYIQRVYQFSNMSNPFSGKVQINYLDGAELKGINETRLTLNIYNGTKWNAYTATSRDVAKNYVLTSGLNNIALNELTLGDICPAPVIQCNRDTVVNAVGDRCGAVVKYNPPVVTDSCGTSMVTQIAGLPSGAFFPVGITTNTFVASSSSGKNDTCSFTVSVKDAKPPFITPVLAFPAILWPPNHAMKDVYLFYFSWDNCGAASCSLDVSSNEPVSGTGYGDKTPDWVIVNNHHVQLRAERSGSGNGRIYNINITCTDASGNTSTQKTQVRVPHNLYSQYSKGQYSFGLENDGYIDANGDYIDHLLDGKVIPNPSKQIFNLEILSSSNEKIEVKLYDITGRFISKLGAVKNQVYSFGEDLHPGIYMIEIIQGRQRKTIKVVKQ